jgi:hypothetical protein
MRGVRQSKVRKDMNSFMQATLTVCSRLLFRVSTRTVKAFQGQGLLLKPVNKTSEERHTEGVAQPRAIADLDRLTTLNYSSWIQLSWQSW